MVVCLAFCIATYLFFVIHFLLLYISKLINNSWFLIPIPQPSSFFLTRQYEFVRKIRNKKNALREKKKRQINSAQPVSIFTCFTTLVFCHINKYKLNVTLKQHPGWKLLNDKIECFALQHQHNNHLSFCTRLVYRPFHFHSFCF